MKVIVSLSPIILGTERIWEGDLVFRMGELLLCFSYTLSVLPKVQLILRTTPH